MQLFPVLFGIGYRRATLHLDTYLLRDDVTLRPVEQDEVRIVQHCGDIDVAKLIKQDSLAVVASVLPNELEDVDLCTLAFDEGSQCTALCGFADGHDAMILYCYDKIHRIIRDIKLAYTHVCNGVFLKSQVYSSHIWSMNIRPFNSRTVGVQKRRALNIFMQTETARGKYFAKYGERIASSLGMPFQTDAERQALFDSLPALASRQTAEPDDLPRSSCWSFTQAPPAPKLGSWFAWNRTASSQLPEFDAGKMILEFWLDGRDAPPDPDDSAVQFHELEKLGKAKTPQETLRRMKMSNHPPCRRYSWGVVPL